MYNTYTSKLRNHLFRFSSPVYPTAVNSSSPSHGQTTPNEQHFYKTTIPINDQQQQHQQTNKSKEHGNGTIITADRQYKETTAATSSGGSGCHCSCNSSCGTTLNNRNSDVTSNIQSGVSSLPLPTTKPCQCMYNNDTTAIMTMRNSQAANGNHTTTTTTTIEYELSNGVAKLCKISSSRIAAEQGPTFSHSSATLNNINRNTVDGNKLSEQENQKPSILPLLSPADFKDLTRNVNAINAYNSNLRQTISQSNHINYQQRANFTMSCSQNGSSSNGARDRLGLWGTGGDNEIPGSVSGLERLQKKKYNKVNMNQAERQICLALYILPPIGG